ncbi:TPA: hypothetical protein OUC02_004937 [Escherichia coli]|nr:hypothetical protein [Escherichia coli]
MRPFIPKQQLAGTLSRPLLADDALNLEREIAVHSRLGLNDTDTTIDELKKMIQQ